MTLIYLLTAGRFQTYIQALAIQGVLLCGIAFTELRNLEGEMNYTNLLFIITETLLFKGIIVPLYLSYLIKKNNIQYEREPHISNFYSLFKIVLIFMGSFILGYKLHHKDFDMSLGYRLGAETIKIVYFTASISAIVTGLLMVIRRQKIITLVIGYLVIENGIFLLSLAIGNEMPIVVNLGILFDIVTTTFLLGVFVNRVHIRFSGDQLNKLSELRD